MTFESNRQWRKKRQRGGCHGPATTVSSMDGVNWRMATLLMVLLLVGNVKSAVIPTTRKDEPPNRINSPNRKGLNGISADKNQHSDSQSSSHAPADAPTRNKDMPFDPYPKSVSQERFDSSFDNIPIDEGKLKAHTEQVERDFMKWCTEVVGIETLLEIQTFQYYNDMEAMPKEDWNDDEDEGVSVVDLPMISVRGLAASRDIAKGEVVIRIPLDSLLSVATNIDKDPILTQVMGPKAREANGWLAEALDDTTALLEIPLLAVTLLYHASLGKHSPLYPYIEILQITQGVDAMPFLWSPDRLRAEASEGVRMVARGIQRDMNDMYDSILEVLIEKYPDIFGRKDSEEWMFSREKFQWAFAMITTRHWQLPIQDLHANSNRKPNSNQYREGADDGELPPASTPTESWVQEHGAMMDDPLEGDRLDKDDESIFINHSFLAPFADLLNFGPPCTRGKYDRRSHSFEITALCDFRKGQEVTFYYSDECDHVVRAVVTPTYCRYLSTDPR